MNSIKIISKKETRKVNHIWWPSKAIDFNSIRRVPFSKTRIDFDGKVQTTTFLIEKAELYDIFRLLHSMRYCGKTYVVRHTTKGVEYRLHANNKIKVDFTVSIIVEDAFKFYFFRELDKMPLDILPKFIMAYDDHIS